ncbi:methyltransferase family protein [Roseinatronobacter bogoriensis]|uniref:Isoprenylcysteine carboxylmethyltransferase family protein n=1 Tax=Roseinatronobacter bogoriensis subsp. barguzinensis TaxID=441209 RepID=A0A2K8K994_9RHOB|nr:MULTISPECIES: isoprenylcysteine carboxylmethyltransferase family protein [Rhodobaca]ATX66019.1 isoprenylcysteine carboxylmethyltransferase family protein [Rhodobaca barguzinensis]MBB4207983.1 protein-S-isoprenylcysteine O-methyltransferase Ste14 [Rhodobaca bogoriensis DSM 18756]TDW38622.1 protein-S-isoprenylcysteine O-methyltransferase Ste14 [Rhodobaca barguzinensis]TDY69339.1 protein-S-isoprenylcysteine O-methyltransferase Ste14 [Rhodobaca bogoriensis DSM 18756]
MLRHIDYPPIWLLFALGIVWIETVLAPQLLGHALIQGFGTLTVALGVVLFALAGWSFLRARSTIIPHQTPQQLITTGIFRLSRNPIYLADVLILVGLSLRWGALSGLILAPILMRVLLVRFIRPEEARILQQFGPAAQRYFAQTRRWL